jgi:hypothetical protein
MSFQISLLVTSWQSHTTGLYNKILNYRMMDFLAQNKRRSNVHKENNTKIENIEKIKISLAAHCAILGPVKKIGPRPNSCVP